MHASIDAAAADSGSTAAICGSAELRCPAGRRKWERRGGDYLGESRAKDERRCARSGARRWPANDESLTSAARRRGSGDTNRVIALFGIIILPFQPLVSVASADESWHVDAYAAQVDSGYGNDYGNGNDQDVDEDEDQDENESLLQRGLDLFEQRHKAVSARLIATAEWLDSFFADERIDALNRLNLVKDKGQVFQSWPRSPESNGLSCIYFDLL